MADNSDNLGDLTVSITGDLSELQAAIDQSVSVANDGGQQIAAALQTIGDASGLAGRDLEILQGIIQQDVDSGVTLAQSLQDIASSASSLGDEIAGGAATALANLQTAEQDAGDAAGVAAGALNDEADAAGRVGESSHEGESGLGAMAEGFLAVGEALAIIEGLKEFVTEAIEVYGATQNVITSLELLGSTSDEAEATISHLADMSLNLAIPFGDLEQAARRLTVAFQGVQGIDVNDVLRTAADSAALTGKSFDQVTTALQRVEVTGAVTSRQLLQLGITWQQLADTAGTSVAAVQALLKKGGQDATADLQLVMNAINQMAAGAAAAQAQTVLGQITILKNQVELLFDAIGQDIAPTVATIVSALSSVIQVARDLATEFQALPQPIKDVAIAIGLAATAIVPLALGVGALGIGLNAVAGIVPAYNSLMAQLASAAGSDSLAEDAAAAATAAHGAAATAATPALERLAVVEGEAGIAAGTTATEIAGLGAAGTEAGAGIEAASLSIGAIAGVSAIALVGITGIISGLRDAATNAVDLKTHVGELTSFFSLAGSGADLLKTAVQSMGAAVGVDSGVTLGLVDAAKALEGEIDKLNASLLAGMWQAFSDQMTGQVGPAIKLLDGLVVQLERDLGLLPGFADQVKAGFAAMTGSIPQISLMTSGTAALAAAEQQLQNNVTSAKQSVQELTALQAAGITTLSNGVTVTTALEAAQTRLTSAQKALATSLGESTKAAKDQKDSWEALETTVNNEAAAMTNAQDTYDALSSAFNAGKDSINGIAVNVKTLADAWNNLAAAQLKATGIMPQWSADAANVSTIVQNQANQFTKLQNAVDQTDAALKSQQDAYNAAVAAGTNTDKQLQLLQIAYDDNQKAIGALSKAVDTTGVSMSDLTGKASEAATVLVNGQAVAIGASTAIDGLAQASQAAGVNQQAFTGFVADGTAKIGDMVITANASAVALDGEAAAADKSTVAVGANAAVTKDSAAAKTAAANAAIVLANKLQLEGQAWADGLIVMQNYAGVLVKETSASTDAASASSALGDAAKQMSADMVQAGEKTNEEANAALSLAADADKAAASVQRLGSALKGVKGGGAGGAGSTDIGENASFGPGSSVSGQLGGADLGSTDLASYLGFGLAYGQNALNAASSNINQGQLDQMAQELADATGQVVTTLDGTFIPAAQAAANAAAAQAAAQTKANTATTASTTATVAATTATTTAASVVTQMAANVTETVDAAGDVTLAITDATGAVTDFTQSAADAADGTENFASATAPTVDALTALEKYLGQSSSATVASTTAANAATTALGTLATATTNVGNALTNIVNSTQSLAQQQATAAANLTAFEQASQAFFNNIDNAGTLSQGGANNGITNPITTQGPLSVIGGPGGTMTFSPGGYVNPNPDLMAGVAQNMASGVNLTINVTGNFAASDQSIQMLAQKVNSAAVTALRTYGGLKN